MKMKNIYLFNKIKQKLEFIIKIRCACNKVKLSRKERKALYKYIIYYSDMVNNDIQIFNTTEAGKALKRLCGKVSEENKKCRKQKSKSIE